MRTSKISSRQQQDRPVHRRVAPVTLALPVSARNGQLPPAWQSLRERWPARKHPKPLAELLKSNGRSPLVWELDDGALCAFVERLAGAGRSNGKKAILAKHPDAAVEAWLRQADAGEPERIKLAVESLAWCHALPSLTTQLSVSVWCALLTRLLDTASRAAQSPPTDCPWAAQMLGGELPLALAYQLPELAECSQLARAGAECVSKGLVDLLDGAGMPHASHLILLRQLLACWTRCAWLVDRLDGIKLSRAARNQFDWLVRQALRTTRPDGSGVLTPPGARNGQLAHRELFRSALQLTRDAQDRAAAELVLLHRDVPAWRLPDEPGYHSEWSELAVLQPHWSAQGPRLTVVYSGRTVKVELTTEGRMLFSTAWQPRIEIGDTQLTVESEWEDLCWFSDEEVDFLEIETDLTGGWQLQRQFLLARRDCFLYAADILLGPQAARINYDLCLDLAAGIEFRGQPETRDGYLGHRRALALVLPLALPEWRHDRRYGTLVGEQGGLILRHAGEGCGLVAPLFFDLDRRRRHRAATWRQLTVAEDLKVVPRDVAVGYRVQVGRQQWLIYRSLRPPGASRTVLGQNLSSEFLAARFRPDGDVESLLEIE